MIKVGIIGAGNAGSAIAAHFAINHCDTGIYDVAEESLNSIRASGGLTLKRRVYEGICSF